MAAASAAERQNNMNSGQLIRIIAAILVYAIIDIIWNILPPVMSMYESLHAASGSPLAEIRRESLDFSLIITLVFRSIVNKK